MNETPLTWQTITDSDIRTRVLEGTALGKLDEIFARSATPRLPLAFTLSKVIPVVSAALCQEKDAKSLAATPTAEGPYRAKFKINTGRGTGGQVCNTYCLLVAPSGSGKGICSLDKQLIKARGWDIGSGGSAEGIEEVFMKIGNGHLRITEMKKYFKEGSYHAAVKEFLTENFNEGSFKNRRTAKEGSDDTRAARFCYPNVHAQVQDKIFARFAHLSDLESGFFGRFLFFKGGRVDAFPAPFSEEESRRDFEEAQHFLELFAKKSGAMTPAPFYSQKLFLELKDAVEDEIVPYLARLCNEYYPRLAVMLSVTDDPATQGAEVVMTDDAWERARLFCLWEFRQALDVLSTLTTDDPEAQRFRRQLESLRRFFVKYEKGQGFTRTDLGKGGTGIKVADREEILAYMEGRKEIFLEQGKWYLRKSS